MSYAKAMKHARNPRKFKLTKGRMRGNWLVFGKPSTAGDNPVLPWKGRGDKP